MIYKEVKQVLHTIKKSCDEWYQATSSQKGRLNLTSTNHMQLRYSTDVYISVNICERAAVRVSLNKVSLSSLLSKEISGSLEDPRANLETAKRKLGRTRGSTAWENLCKESWECCAAAAQRFGGWRKNEAPWPEGLTTRFRERKWENMGRM